MLTHSLILGHSEIVVDLVAMGADVNLRTADGCSALYLAVQNAHAGIAKHLIEHGADVGAFKVGT